MIILFINTIYTINHNTIILYFYKILNVFLGFKQYVSFYNIKDNSIKFKVDDNAKRILFVSNHVNYSDFINIQKFIATYYYEFIPIYLILNKIKNNYYVNPAVNILIHNFLIIDNIYKLEEECNNLYNNSICNNKKYIIIIFPELCIRNKYNIQKDKEWCKNNNIKPFKNLLYPHCDIFKTITNNFIQEKTILNTIVYSDDLFNNKSSSIYDFIFMNVAKCCHMYILDISLYSQNLLELSNSFYKIWRIHDDIINIIYKCDIYRKYIYKGSNFNIIFIILCFLLYLFFK